MLIFIFCIVSYAGGKCFSFELGNIPFETITGKLESRNGYSWNYGYDIGFEGGKVLVYVAINLVNVGNVTKIELDRMTKIWKKGIEDIWSDQFFIIDSSGKQFPIVISVKFTGLKFHHEVIIRSGGRKTDELNWNITDHPDVVAHEFGHMLGLFDEYRNGAISSKFIDVGSNVNKSIMATGSDRGKPTKSHYKRFLEWFGKNAGLDNLKLSF